MNRKSQAALEFIMTYGWAILVVLVAIGALAYFGVLSPDKFLPNKCTLQAGIACLDHKVTPTTLVVFVKNALGNDISVEKVTADKCTELAAVTPLANDETYTFTFATCVNPTGGNKYNGKIGIYYKNIDTGIYHNNTGQITSKVE